MSNTAIDRVSNPSQSLVAESNHRVEPLVSGNPGKELGSVAGTKHLVHGREVGGALVGVKVRSKNTAFHALSPKKLAGTAWPTTISLASSHLPLQREGG